MKKIFLLISILTMFNISVFAKLEWEINKIEFKNYSQRYPRELRKFILWTLKNKQGEIYYGISVNKRKFKKFKKGDIIWVLWDQYPDIPRDMLHTVYTYIDSNLLNKKKKAVIIIGDIEYVK